MFEKVSKEYPVIAWFSGGIASAVEVYVCICLFGIENIRIVFMDTGNEDEDTERFLVDCEKWYGKKIERLTFIGRKYGSIQDVWRRFNSLNVAHGAICSSELKRELRMEFQRNEKYSYQAHGFDITESKRAIGMSLNYADSNPIYPLMMLGLQKKDLFKIVQDAGIRPPRVYEFGFHNNNCFKTGCVQGGVGYWQKMGREFPEKFDAMAKVEHELTDRKGKPVTMLKEQSKKGEEVKKVFLKPHPDYPDVKDISMMNGREPKPLMECNGFCGLDDLNTPDKTALEELNFDSEEVVSEIKVQDNPVVKDSIYTQSKLF